jgi:hypothetical protein
MGKSVIVLVICSLVAFLSLMPMVFGVNVGGDLGLEITTEDFVPLMWQCDSRMVLDDATEPGRISEDGENLTERINNYLFEGEQIVHDYLVMDKNGIDKVLDVYVTVFPIDGDDEEGEGTFVTIERSVEFCDSIPSMRTAWNSQIMLPKFDSSLGNLTDVELFFASGMRSDASIENLDAQPAVLTVSINGSIVATLPNGDVVQVNVPFDSEQFNASAFDGLSDFAGTSGTMFLDLSALNNQTILVSNISEFIATFFGEDFDINVSASGSGITTGASNLLSLILTNASAEACVTYDYETTRFIPDGDGGIEANCFSIDDPVNDTIPLSCNAQIDEEELTEFDDSLMGMYRCVFTVETPESMYGEHFIYGEVVDLDGLIGNADESEFFFLNPVIALNIDGDLFFDETLPGTSSYSDTILIENVADVGSGVILDMFISGTDFYDSSSSGARCPTTNQLALSNFRYYATNGAYSTQDDIGLNVSAPRDRNVDAEGYVNIGYGIGFNDPTPFYDGFEIIQAFNGSIANSEDKTGAPLSPYYTGNFLDIGADMALTFKLDLPEPCNGDFDSGSIYFWGEAV